MAQPAEKENMWYGCVGDSAFGQLVRFATRRHMFKFLDERNPEIWTKLVNEETSGYAADHGMINPHGGESDMEGAEGIGGVRT
jgi:hypothetical protein